MLTPRQQEFYLDTFDVWKHPGHSEPFQTDANNTVINLVYSDLGSPDRTGDKGMLQSQREGNLYERPLGRTAFDNIFTLDSLFVAADSDLEDQDVIRITSPGPLHDEYLVVQGEGRARRSRGIREGNYKVLQLKRSNAPQTVGDGAGPAFSSGFSSGFDIT